jgi:hypothetical protein
LYVIVFLFDVDAQPEHHCCNSITVSTAAAAPVLADAQPRGAVFFLCQKGAQAVRDFGSKGNFEHGRGSSFFGSCPHGETGGYEGRNFPFFRNDQITALIAPVRFHGDREFGSVLLKKQSADDKRQGVGLALYVIVFQFVVDAQPEQHFNIAASSATAPVLADAQPRSAAVFLCQKGAQAVRSFGSKGNFEHGRYLLIYKV